MKATYNTVTDQHGVRGILESTRDDGQERLMVRLPDNRRVEVSRDELQAVDESGYRLPRGFDELGQVTEPASEHIQTIPVMEEELVVGKRTKRSGVRIHKTVHEREEQVDLPHSAVDVQVERIPMDKVVDEPPGVRTEGDTTIIPVLEEVAVVEKRWVLREELRITRHRIDQPQPERVTLRREEVAVEPLEPQ